jgi:hypothetical protein
MLTKAARAEGPGRDRRICLPENGREVPVKSSPKGEEWKWLTSPLPSAAVRAAAHVGDRLGHCRKSPWKRKRRPRRGSHQEAGLTEAVESGVVRGTDPKSISILKFELL